MNGIKSIAAEVYLENYPDASERALEVQDISLNAFSESVETMAKTAASVTEIQKRGILRSRILISSQIDLEEYQSIKDGLERIIASVAIRSYVEGFRDGQGKNENGTHQEDGQNE